jgi:hypothetical protein
MRKKLTGRVAKLYSSDYGKKVVERESFVEMLR